MTLCLDELLDYLLNDTDTICKLHIYLLELYNNSAFDVITGILKTFYLVLGMEIPLIIEAIFSSENETVKGSYLTEFLQDFDDIAFDNISDE